MKVAYIEKFDYYFSSANYIAAAFNKIGVEVMSIPIDTPWHTIREMIISYEPDFVLCSKGADYFERLVPWIKACGIPLVHWSFDRLFYLDRAQTVIRNRKLYTSDLVFTTDGGCDEQWQEQFKVHHRTLRQGVHGPDRLWLDPVPKDFDIVFIGSVYNECRRNLVGFLSSTYGSRFKVFGASEKPEDQVRGLHLNELLRSVKIVVGDSLPGDHYWSNRLYEQRGRGGFLLHPHTVGMGLEFEIGKELVLYPRDNMHELKNIIDYYVDHDEERERIRLCGFNRCPTYEDRVRTMMHFVQAIIRRRQA